jgi:hypothetical protein
LTRYLIELWLLAEYLLVPMLQNYVLGVIVGRTSRRNLCLREDNEGKYTSEVLCRLGLLEHGKWVMDPKKSEMVSIRDDP